MNKKIPVIFLLLLPPLVVLLARCPLDPPQAAAGRTAYQGASAGFADTKVYSNATLEGEFAEDRVVVVLNMSSSLNFRTYTPEDFSEVNCARVTDSTRLTMELVRRQLEAQKTGNWSGLEKHVKSAMLVNVDKFRRILDLTLPVN